jgi:hypothetical protein
LAAFGYGAAPGEDSALSWLGSYTLKYSRLQTLCTQAQKSLILAVTGIATSLVLTRLRQIAMDG